MIDEQNKPQIQKKRLALKILTLFLGCNYFWGEWGVAEAPPALQVPVAPSSATVPASKVIPATATLPASAKVWNLENADIRFVINQVALATGKNFVIDPRVQGKINFISTAPLEPGDVYSVFLKVLQTHGYAAVQSGKVIEIVPDNTAKLLEIPTLTFNMDSLTDKLKKVKNQKTSLNPAVEGFVTQIIPVKYTSVTQLVPILRPLLPSQSSEISAYAANNTLIISAEADKIAQIEKIIAELDQPNAANIQIVPLHYADAAELVSSLKSIMNAANVSSTKTDVGVNIAADKNSNSVLLSGPEIQRNRLSQVILRMDRLSSNSASSSITTVVVPLRYLQAKVFASVLQKMVGGSGFVDTSSSSEISTKSSTDNRTVPGLPSYNALLNSNNNNAAVSDSSGSSSGGGSGKIQIQAEVETNAILMSGPPAQIRALKEVIAKLDTKPQQVLVEAIIAEVSETTLKNLGVEWGTLPPSDQLVQSASGVTSNNASSNLAPPFPALVGGSGVGILDLGRFKAVIRALATDSKTNILSTPSVVVLDNQEATVKVGKTITDVTGSYITPNNANTPNTQGPFQTFSPKEIALHLTVTPQISFNEMIRLKIDQGNDTQLATVTNGNPDTSNSAIKTSVIMKSGQVLVIGGLISNDYEDNIQKTPILGDIPILGKLFQHKSDNLAKKDLLVFLRPVIINDKDGSADQQTSIKYNLIRELELSRKKNADILTPSNANTVLPRYPAKALPQPFN